MQNYICDGERITAVAGAAIKSGDLIFVGAKAAVAITDADMGSTFSAQTEGVFELAKVTGAITQGQLLYFDTSAEVLTTVSGANIFVGYAYKPAANADTIVQVCIVDNPDSNPVVLPVQAASVATDVAGLKADFNTLLASLKTAGLMANA